MKNKPANIIFALNILSYFCVFGLHWWKFEEELNPHQLPSFTPLPEQRFTHSSERNQYAPAANDVIVNIPKAGMGMFVGSSFQINYDYTWTEWPPRVGRLVNAFLGLPYAAPPLGEMRFRMPVPAYLDTRFPWYAKQYKPSCMQEQSTAVAMKLLNLNEDCLYLNVFAPNRSWEEPNIRYPVLVHIHGGSHVSGGSEAYPGHVLASKGVVFVSFNYRLGVFGFLSTGDPNLVGNYGLWDQLLAMRWVKDNIEWFGGDPNRITLMGESAGAASVGIHSISPMSQNQGTLLVQAGVCYFHSLTIMIDAQGTNNFSDNFDDGLFHQIIMISGSDLANWAVSDPSLIPQRYYAIKLGRKLGCDSIAGFYVEPSDAETYNSSYINLLFNQSIPSRYDGLIPGNIDTNALLRCLRHEKSAEDIINASNTIKSLPGAPNLIWTPVPDGNDGILPRMPIEIRKCGCFAKLPTLAGVVRDEGSKILFSALRTEVGMNHFDLEQFDDQIASNLLSKIVSNINVYRPNVTAEELFVRYNWWPNMDNYTALWNRFVALMSDYQINAPLQSSVRSYLPGNADNVYFFEFAYISPNDTRDPIAYGVYHGAELPFLYGCPFLKLTSGQPGDSIAVADLNFHYPLDSNISEFVMDLWINFVTFGNPTPKPVKNITWTPYRLGEEAYLYIAKNSSMHYKFRTSDMAFWRERFIELAAPIPPFPAIFYFPRIEYKLPTIILGCTLALALIVLFILVYCILRTSHPNRFKHEVRLASPNAPPGAVFRTAFTDAFTNRTAYRPPSPPCLRTGDRQHGKRGSLGHLEHEASISLIPTSNQYEPLPSPFSCHPHPPPPPIPVDREVSNRKCAPVENRQCDGDSDEDELRTFTMDI